MKGLAVRCKPDGAFKVLNLRKWEKQRVKKTTTKNRKTPNIIAKSVEQRQKTKTKSANQKN